MAGHSHGEIPGCGLIWASTFRLLPANPGGSSGVKIYEAQVQCKICFIVIRSGRGNRRHQCSVDMVTVMMKPEPEQDRRRELLLPKWAIPCFWAAIVLVIMGFLPWIVAKVGPRYGWTQRRPGWWNIAGLLAVAAGLAMYAWCLVFHFRKLPHVPCGSVFSPPHLVVAGPYRVSRNPMYVSGLFAWAGWTVFLWQPTVLAAFVLLWSPVLFSRDPARGAAAGSAVR